jgi:hypothetical protein
LRRLILAALIVACARPVDDRYAALRASLAADNGYARLRLARYRAWQTLPEMTLQADAYALGREAFFKLPLQKSPGKDGFGLQHLVDGHFTCATCHTHNGVEGAPNVDLDLGAAIIANFDHPSDEGRAIAMAWGKGRVDVSSVTGKEPARIPDLRPVRYQKFLQYSGAVKKLDRMSLELRIETLIITATQETARPSHALARALAIYVESLADSLPTPPPQPAVFTRECASCHEGDELIDVDEVGTDPTLARSIDRGTGKYRAPTLRGVRLRAPLMHDGSIASLGDLLYPGRAGGHRFGLDLSDADRAVLLGYLQKL